MKQNYSCLIVKAYIIYQEQGKVKYWKQSSNRNFIHKDVYDFPYLSQNFNHCHAYLQALGNHGL